jgi:glutamine amidotransferase
MTGGVEPLAAPGLKVPHIGWEPMRLERESALTDGIESGTPFYFVHSLTVRPENPVDALGTAVYGERFACAVERPPLYGFQFHPEKSSAAGLRLLENFTGVCADTAVPV